MFKVTKFRALSLTTQPSLKYGSIIVPIVQSRKLRFLGIQKLYKVKSK